MKLADWLAARNMTQQAFADQIGVTQGRVSQICLRGCGDITTAHTIVIRTDYEVDYADLLPQTEAAE